MSDTVDDDVDTTVAFTKIDVFPVNENLVKILTWYKEELVSTRYSESYTILSANVSFIEVVS